jgi:23S rRNA (adenine2503-C2)-methyltransferase
MTGARPLILDLDPSGLAEVFAGWGEPAYRARQVFRALYVDLAASPGEITTLPQALRQRLDEHFAFAHLTPEITLDSRDGETRKTLFRLPDGEAIEAVLMRYEKRRTLCISTQAGCAMGCVFCATGQMGFRSNLTSGQIVEQVLYYARLLKAQNDRPTNVVVMGMGEPFHNYDATITAIQRLNHPDGFNFGARRVTISTVGLIPQIKRYTQERHQMNLAISLHAADDDLRAAMLPINKRYPIRDLIAACREYAQVTGRRVTFEWALIQGVNDTPEQAGKLAGLIGGFESHVNVIPLNPTTGYNGQAATRERARAFADALTARGVPCTIRIRRGIDINAGCGQLAIGTKHQVTPW